LEYIIGGIALLICIFLAGFFMKKKYYKETDRLESWKMEITNRPVLDELQKIKRLNMSGETEERFDRWRKTWDDVVSTILPDIEELLFDVEEQIDKYHFKKAKQIQLQINETLSKVEDTINKLLSELEELVGSEEKNRIEIDELKETYRECKKTLLAHRYLFGKMEKPLEGRLETISKLFIEFDENTTNGNYLAAREIVLNINELATKTKSDMDVIPNLLNECQSIIPTLLAELHDGYREMDSQGYQLEHISIEEEKERITEELGQCLSEFEQAEMKEVQEKVDGWKKTIDEFYNLLEKEVLARLDIKKKDREILKMLQTARSVNYDLNDEFIRIQSSYHLQDSDMEIIEKLGKRLEQLHTRFDLIGQSMNENKVAFSHLQEEMLSIKETLEIIASEQAEFAEKMQALRKDELAAREKVAELKKIIAETIRMISKSNIPGVPEEYMHLMNESQDSIEQVIAKLNETPLDISIIQEYLEVAVITVEKMTKDTTDLFETVALAEKVIQYGNRYRSKYPSVAEGLKDAEKAFRTYQYQEALEKAIAAVEKVEPGVVKKIESNSEDLIEV
jgi:septation ring formation regulator